MKWRMIFILQHYPPSFPSLWEAGNNPVSGPGHVESCVSAATFVCNSVRKKHDAAPGIGTQLRMRMSASLMRFGEFYPLQRIPGKLLGVGFVHLLGGW